MKEFLQEFWLWILIPFVLMIGLLVVVLIFGMGDGSNPFVYNVQ